MLNVVDLLQQTQLLEKTKTNMNDRSGGKVIDCFLK